MTVTSMEYRGKSDGKRRLGQVIQLGLLQESIDLSATSLMNRTNLPTGKQATYRDQAMAIEHNDPQLEVRVENIPLVIPHFGPDPLKGFDDPLLLSDTSLYPWAIHLPLFFRELVAGTDVVCQWFEERKGVYPKIHLRLLSLLKNT